MEISFDISSGVLLEVHPCFPSEIPLEISLRISVRNYSKLPWMEFFSKFSWNLFIYPSNSSGVSSKNSLGNFFRIRMFLQGFLQKLHTNNWRFLERIHEKIFINTWKIVWSNPLKTLLVIPLKIPRKKNPIFSWGIPGQKLLNLFQKLSLQKILDECLAEYLKKLLEVPPKFLKKKIMGNFSREIAGEISVEIHVVIR